MPSMLEVKGAVQVACKWEKDEHKNVDAEVYVLILNGPLFPLSLSFY